MPQEQKPGVEASSVVRQHFLLAELEQAIECIRTGLERLAEGPTVLRYDAATLFLLANGLERYLKVGVHILYLHAPEDRPKNRALGHNLDRAANAILSVEGPEVRVTERCVEDLHFAKNDSLLLAFLDCLNAFADKERYFMLNGAAGDSVVPDRNPRALWEDVLALTPGTVPTEISRALIGRMQRYLRCMTQAVWFSTTGDARSLASDMYVFLSCRDDVLGTPVSR